MNELPPVLSPKEETEGVSGKLLEVPNIKKPSDDLKINLLMFGFVMRFPKKTATTKKIFFQKKCKADHKAHSWCLKTGSLSAF